MCTGTEMAWITAALTAASAGAQYTGNKKSQKAMESMRALERQRQEGMQKDSAVLTQESIDQAGVEKAEADIGKAATERQAAYEAAGATRDTEENAKARELGVASQNKVIGGNVESEKAMADAYGAIYNKGASRIGGLTDRTLANNIQNNRFLNRQATIGNYMQGSLGVLPIELEAANRKGDNMRTLGDILGTAATVTGLMAATGVNPFASSAAAPTTGTTVADVASNVDAANAASASSVDLAGAYSPLDYNLVSGAYAPVGGASAVPSFLPANMAAPLPGATPSFLPASMRAPIAAVPRVTPSYIPNYRLR